MVRRPAARYASDQLAAIYEANAVARQRTEQRENGRSVFDYYAKTEVQSVAGGAALAKTNDRMTSSS